MKIFFLTFFIMFSTLNLQAGVYTTEEGQSFDINCDSDISAQIWLARHTLVQNSTYCWHCFSWASSLVNIYSDAALITHAKVIAPEAKSEKEVYGCIQQSSNSLREKLSSGFSSDAIVGDYYSEVFTALKPCLCN